MLGSLCIAGGCSTHYDSTAAITCPSDPPHAHYVVHRIPGYYVCSSSSGLSPPNSDGGVDVWGMRGTDAGSSSSGSGSGSGQGCSYSSSGSGSGSSSSSGSGSGSSWHSDPCPHETWVDGSAFCALECDSNATLCGSVCVDLLEDANNCGACGHACKQQCFAGSCQPVTTIFAAPESIHFLAVRGGALYWSQAHAIGRAPTAMLSQHTFVSDRLIAGGPVADDAAVYWTEMTMENELHVVSHVDGRPDAVLFARPAKSRSAIARIAVDDENVYFTDEPEKTDASAEATLITPTIFSPYALFATSKFTGITRGIAPITSASDVVAGGGWIYFIETNNTFCHLRRVRPIGGTMDDFDEVCPKRLLAADGEAVYYDDGVVIQRRLHDVSYTTAVAGSGSITTDAQAFYTTSGFDILRIERPSGPRTTLASLQTPTELAVSGDLIFWANDRTLRSAHTTLP